MRQALTLPILLCLYISIYLTMRLWTHRELSASIDKQCNGIVEERNCSHIAPGKPLPVHRFDTPVSMVFEADHASAVHEAERQGALSPGL
jgi:hypothetical protein